MAIVKSLCFQIAYSIIAKTAADHLVGGCYFRHVWENVAVFKVISASKNKIRLDFTKIK